MKKTKAGVTTASGHGLNPGDRVVVSGLHGLAARFNGEHTVVEITEGAVYFDAPCLSWWRRWLYNVVSFAYRLRFRLRCALGRIFG